MCLDNCRHLLVRNVVNVIILTFHYGKFQVYTKEEKKDNELPYTHHSASKKLSTQVQFYFFLIPTHFS